MPYRLLEKYEKEWLEFKKLNDMNKTAIIKAIKDTSDGFYPHLRFIDKPYEEFIQEGDQNQLDNEN